MNVFDKLLKNDVCFAVVVSQIAISPVDYCIVGAKKDSDILRAMNFTDEKSHSLILEHKMNKKEVYKFLRLLSNGVLKKVKDNAYGKVYELHDNSFKKYLNQKKEDRVKKIWGI